MANEVKIDNSRSWQECVQRQTAQVLSHTITRYIFQIHFSIIFPFTVYYSSGPFPLFMSDDCNFVYSSHRLYACYTLRSSHHPCCGDPTTTHHTTPAFSVLNPNILSILFSNTLDSGDFVEYLLFNPQVSQPPCSTPNVGDLVCQLSRMLIQHTRSHQENTGVLTHSAKTMAPQVRRETAIHEMKHWRYVGSVRVTEAYSASEPLNSGIY